MIAVEALSYTYPHSDYPALQQVSLQVAAGDFVLLAGPSGSGKSTLLRTFNGLVPHFSGGTIAGRVSVNGVDAVSAGPQVLSRHVGFVLQNPEAQAVLDHVEPEIAFALENAAVPPQEMRVRVEEVLDLLDLASLRDRALVTLSGGERQRVAIAAALALRPSILLLDEPTSQLDPQSAEEVLRSLVRLNEDLGLTIVLAEHRLERVLKYADRLIYLENGCLMANGPVRDVVGNVEDGPPLVQLGRELGWSPLPLTVKEGKRLARRAALAPAGAADTVPRPAPKEAAAEPPLLEIDNLHFRYNGSQTLNGVSLDVRPSEAVVLMGRNGSGKTTLLKCVIGLLQMEKGQVRVRGRAVAGRTVAEISREVAYLPQNPDDLLFAESVSAELRTTLRNHGLEARNGVADLLGQLGLANVASAYPRDLSVGQRQRVALGAVTITQPPLLLLDEPTRGLDAGTKKELVALWRGWLQRGRGLLLVTHDVELAALIADRVLILSQGEVIASGRPSEVLSASPLFAPQIARLFPNRNWLTVDDALKGLKLVQ